MKKIISLMILFVMSFAILGITTNAANLGVSLQNRYGVTFTGMSYDGTNSAALQTMLEQADGDTASERFVGWTSSEWTGLKNNNDVVSYVYNMWLAQNYFTIEIQQNYELKDYLVRWYNGASLLKSEYVDHGSNGTPPANPSKTGHSFTGWDQSYTNVISDLNIYAEFTPYQFYVTFKDWDDSTVSMQLISYGDNATPPNPPPTRSGYRFIGWYPSYYNITATTTVTALYSKLYTVTFNTNNGSPSYSNFTFTEGENINLSNYAPVRDEYNFIGWYADWENASYEDGIFTSASTLHPSNVTFTATWTASATYQEGWNEGHIVGQALGEEIGYQEGFNDALLYYLTNGFGDRDKDSLSYSNGYIQGQADVDNDYRSIQQFIPGLLGLIFGFFFQLASISVMGISILDVLALLFAIGLVILIIKIFT